jgi:hypothetical protein
MYRSTARAFPAILLIASFALSAVAAPPAVPAPPAEGIVIDGALDEPAWTSGPWTEGFVGFGTETPPEQETRVAVRHDNAYLYIAAVAEERDPAALEMDYTPTNGENLWADDVLEFMVDPTGKRTDYVHLMVTPRGFFESGWMAQGGQLRDGAWQSAAEVAAQVTDDGWQVELKIPMAEMNLTADSLAGDWAVMVTRVQRAGRERVLSTLAPLSSSFHEPKRFLPLKLQEPRLENMLWQVDGPGEAEVVSYDGELLYRCEATVTNNTGTARWMHVGGELAAGGRSASDKAVEKIEPGETQTLPLRIPCPQLGEAQLTLTARSGQGPPLAMRALQVELEHDPLIVRVHRPFYRNNIYATEDLSHIELTASLAISEKQARGSRITAELRAADREGEPLASTSAVLEGRAARLRLPAADLPEGRYALAVTARGATDEPVRIVKEIRKLPAVEHEWRIDEDLRLLHNGEPFLPYGWFAWSPEEDPAGEGVTTAYRYHQPLLDREEHLAFLDGLYAEGVYVLVDAWPKSLYRKNNQAPLSDDEASRLREWIRSLKDHPAVFGWYMYDEPEYKPVLIERARRAYEIIAEEDPYHPCVMLNMRPDAVGRYAVATDVLMPDSYPVFVIGDSVGRSIGKISSMMKTCRQASSGRKAWWIVPMAFEWPGMNPDSRPPTFTELRNQQLQAFIGGARGLLWYQHNFREEWTDLDVGVPFLGREAEALRPALLAPEIPGGVKVQAPVASQLRAAVRRANGHWYVFAVNTEDAPQQGVRLEIDGLGDQTLHVLSERRSLAAEDGAFTDDFAPFAGHIYTTDPDLTPRQTLAAVQRRIDAIDAELYEPANLAHWRNGARFEASSILNYAGKPRQIINSRGDFRFRDGTRDKWPDWVQVRFPETKTVGRVACFGHNFKDYEVQVLRDGEYETVASGTASTNTPLVVSFEPVEADAVRVVVKSISPTPTNRINNSFEDRTLLQRIEAYAN